MNSCLSADDVLTLLFILKGMDKEVSEDEIIDFISMIFKVRKEKKRNEVIELDIPNKTNYDNEMFTYNDNKFYVVNEKLVLENYRNIIYDEELMTEVKQAFENMNDKEAIQKRIR